MSVRAISYGGGVQSTALLVLAARREIDFPLAIFANVGDDSEHPSCWFCPFKGRADWRRLKRETPDLFAKAVQLDDTLRERSIGLGRGACYLSAAMRPLDQVLGDHDQLDLFADGATCDVGGYCHA
jgi:hypothetical protein